MPPITIFGKPLGLPTAKSGTGAKTSPSGITSGRAIRPLNAPSKVQGRSGAQGPPAKNAGSSVYAFKQTVNAGNTYNYPLTGDSDFIGLNFGVTTTQSSSTVSVDVLTGLSQVQILAPDGPVVTMNPSPDFYTFVQRFGPYGVAPTVVNVPSATVTTSASAYVNVPLNLPAAKGPYTLVLTAASLASQTNVIVELQLQQGTCPNGKRTRFAYTNLPFTPSASGTNDISPVAAIQDADLQELFLTGLTSNVADIAYLQIISEGSTVAPRVTGQFIQTSDTQYLSGSLNSTYLYPLLALQTTIRLGRNSHIYATWGSSPSSSIREGFCWED